MDDIVETGLPSPRSSTTDGTPPSGFAKMAPSKSAKRSMQEQYASAEDWDAQRETISRLYLHEKRSLQEVMEYMAQNHAFFATVKMYRTRIRKWGIDKNNKAAEVAYMLKLKKQRDAQGKASNFFIRGRPVDWEDIERYLARTPDFWAKHGTQPLDGHSKLAKDITCTTPPPESPKLLPASTNLAVLPNLNAARELHVHEEILRFFRVYTEGSFEQGHWRLFSEHNRYFGPGGVEANARLNTWYDKVRNVSDWPGRNAEAVQLINYLLDDLPQFIKDQDFSIFPALMKCCYYLSHSREELGRAVVHFVARLCVIILGEKHPMAMAWARIKSLPKSEYLRVLQGTAKIRLDQLEALQAQGREDENTMAATREYLLVLRLRGKDEAAELERVTEQAKEQVSKSPDKLLTPAQYRLLLGTASSYIARQRFAEASEILDRVGAALPTAAAQDSRSQRVVPTYLFLMGFLRYVTQRMDEASNYFLQTYYTLERVRGPNSSAVADIMLAMIDFPGLLQKPEDIALWHQRFSNVQAQMLVQARKRVRHTASELSEVWDGPIDTDVNTGMW